MSPRGLTTEHTESTEIFSLIFFVNSVLSVVNQWKNNK
jgi:hypothetical protein